MFQRRRRSASATAGNELPFCGMCGQANRVDSNGRCALGHRVGAPQAAAAPVLPEVPELAETTVALSTLAPADADHDLGPLGHNYVDSYDDGVVWDRAHSDISGPAPAGALDEFIAWDEPVDTAFSALDMDTNELPVAEVAPVTAGLPVADAALLPLPSARVHDLGGSLLDELDEIDDATHARRQAVGTIGATIVGAGMVFVAVAALPF